MIANMVDSMWAFNTTESPYSASVGSADSYNVSPGVIGQGVGAGGGEDADAVDPELALLEQHLEITRFVIQRVLVPLIVLFGVVGNMLNIAVLTRRWMRSSTNMYLCALAICDVLYLTFSLLMSLKHYQGVKDAMWFTKFAKPFGKPLIDTYSNTGVWLTLTFTVERYIGVCHPMKGKRWCTPERARYIIIAVFISVIIITFPEFFEYRSGWITSPRNKNLSEFKAYQTDFGTHPSYKWGYVYTNNALFTFLPLLLLLIFNTFLIRAVMKATKQRRSMAKLAVVQNDRQERHHREQHKITLMLISVVIVFLVCQLPQAITHLYITYLIFSDRMTLVIRFHLLILGNVFNLLVITNCSINFILYSSFSMKFRQTFHRLFCKCLSSPAKKEHIFSDVYSNDGSKTNLIMNIHHHTGHGASPMRAPNGKPRNNFPTAYQRPSNIEYKPPLRTKNGYLEVKQTSDGPDTLISSV